MKELLLSLGYKLKGSCSCGGTYQETYRKSASMIEIAPKIHKFRIIAPERGKRISEDLFEQTLRENGIIQ